jgi:hypothetical protein
MRSRAALLSLVVLCSAVAFNPARAQAKVIDLTVDMLDRWFTAHDKEKSESANVAPQLNEQNEKIKKFQQCKAAWEAAGEATGKKLGGIAARIAIKAKCGVSDDAAFVKERQKIMDGPENAAATAGGFKLADYRNLRDKLQAYVGGDHSGFTKAGLDLLKSREKQLASAFGVSMTVAGAGGAGMRGPAVWGADYAWIYIAQLFAIQYGTGATMFETDYKPGEWTRWKLSSDSDDDVQTNERAFIGKPSDGGEWWRMKTISGDKESSDTVSLEMLFKTESPDDVSQKLVRMRGKLPGNAEPQELIVPEQYGMWNMAGSMGRRPTKESIEGATIGVETVTTPAGTFRAKHVRFGMGGGTMDWWLDDTVVGGWVKFQMLDENKKPRYTMELVAKGTGAKSELGVTIK